jgi:hypothetical protein
MRKRFKVLRWRQDSGTIAPLVAGYLALVVMAILLGANVISAMAYSHRLQGVVDAAVIFGHDRALRAGVPNNSLLSSNIRTFLEAAPSAKRLELAVINPRVRGSRSELELCAIFRYPLALGSGVVCKSATAESFLLP